MSEGQQENSLRQLRQELEKSEKKNFTNQFNHLHLFEQGQFYLLLERKERLKLYQWLTTQAVADLFDMIEEEELEMGDYLAEMPSQYAAEVLAKMYTDNAVDVLNELSRADKNKYFSLMDSKRAQQLKDLLHHEDQTAGAIMTTEYVSISANQTVASAMKQLKEEAKQAETIYTVYVVSEEKQLVGVLSLRELLTSEDDLLVAEIMHERVLAAKLGDDQLSVAQTIRDYDLLALPVTDYEELLLGIVTIDDIIDIIDEEATSDYSGLAGVDVDEASENPFKAASKRLPWLITLLFLGMSTASLISHYEELVSEASILAVFISLITGTAGNAGTQSLAVAVRRLAIQDEETSGFWKLVSSEVLTGLVTGAITGLTIFLIVGFWKQNFILGFVIGVAMLFAITVANLAGSLIPMIMDRLGFDPAVASGPFITTLSDLTSVLIYFNIASLFMKYFIN